MLSLEVALKQAQSLEMAQNHAESYIGQNIHKIKSVFSISLTHTVHNTSSVNCVEELKMIEGTISAMNNTQ